MKALNLSPANLFYLQQLSTLVKQKANVRYSISDPTDAIHMLRFCCRSNDHQISETYHSFLTELDSSQRDFLHSYGLTIAA
ncbi:hypothetical protein ACVBE9_09545 [Eionea flava]